jgi:hypothetical protein
MHHFQLKVGRIVIPVYFILVFLFFHSCSQSEWDISAVKREEFAIKPLAYNMAPYYYSTLAPLKTKEPTDKDGIALYNYKDKGLYYQPVFLCLKALHFISSYIISNEKAYLKRADRYARKMVELADKHNGALFFPYKFDNPLSKKRPGGEQIVMKAPWYSGMAQGQALSVFSRLYSLTKNQEYLEIAHKIFKSFLLREREDSPWVVYVDKKSYMWIEECPDKDRINILNGFIFGIYGVYDYYQVTKDERSKILFQAGVKTVKRYIHFFRNPGDRSWYCLGKFHKTTPKYHNVHVKQLEMLYRMTGDEYFLKMSRRFYRDYHQAEN